MFKPRPSIEALALPGGATAFVIDDALEVPARWRNTGVRHAEGFRPDPLAGYPVQRIALPGPLLAPLGQFFSEHLRDRLGFRRVLATQGWLSLATAPPLAPVRASAAEPGQGTAVAVLFLSEDPATGGLVFPAAPLLDDEDAARVPARYNRLVVFDGGRWHAPDITSPERLAADPATGRLVLEARFTCRRRLG
ncbi:MAG: hypothetical protein ABS41_12915 [Arenimonas sp. SCN 70-307]|uniref:DUF6445 family protein n=1 Tax=Arenimonas sp. SCN 70-307 TaxID=1660089 RepID=UPI00086DE0F5|nr:DUF6445 family protein [Arenimonas sp. SCN 70-307]ODS61485.1 MAG: hypothetical protein ABS41_12915 [Arenimonas sp. SCN 70-307]